MYKQENKQPIFFLYEFPAAPQPPSSCKRSEFDAEWRPSSNGNGHLASATAMKVKGDEGQLSSLISMWTQLRELPRGAHTGLAQAAEEFALAAMGSEDKKWRRNALQSVLRELERQHLALATRLSRERRTCPYTLAARNKVVIIKRRVRAAIQAYVLEKEGRKAGKESGESGNERNECSSISHPVFDPSLHSLQHFSYHSLQHAAESREKGMSFIPCKHPEGDDSREDEMDFLHTLQDLAYVTTHSYSLPLHRRSARHGVMVDSDDSGCEKGLSSKNFKGPAPAERKEKEQERHQKGNNKRDLAHFERARAVIKEVKTGIESQGQDGRGLRGKVSCFFVCSRKGVEKKKMEGTARTTSTTHSAFEKSLYKGSQLVPSNK